MVAPRDRQLGGEDLLELSGSERSDWMPLRIIQIKLNYAIVCSVVADKNDN